MTFRPQRFLVWIVIGLLVVIGGLIQISRNESTRTIVQHVEAQPHPTCLRSAFHHPAQARSCVYRHEVSDLLCHRDPVCREFAAGDFSHKGVVLGGGNPHNPSGLPGPPQGGSGPTGPAGSPGPTGPTGPAGPTSGLLTPVCTLADHLIHLC